jgi:hypothetical protein
MGKKLRGKKLCCVKKGMGGDGLSVVFPRGSANVADLECNYSSYLHH